MSHLSLSLAVLLTFVLVGCESGSPTSRICDLDSDAYGALKTTWNELEIGTPQAEVLRQIPEAVRRRQFAKPVGGTVVEEWSVYATPSGRSGDNVSGYLYFTEGRLRAITGAFDRIVIEDRPDLVIEWRARK